MSDPADPSPPTVRHAAADRLFHWVMAVTVVLLGASAFLPILGVKFDWVPIHWISGVVLGVAVLYHLWRVFGVHGVGEMMPAKSDLAMLRREVLLRHIPDEPSGKFDVFQKLYHWTASLVILILAISGFIMLAKIDTPFWARNPAILSDWNWGVVYVVHGAAALVLLFLFILHVYFAFLPEHRALLRSMVLGTGPERAHKPSDGSNS